MNSYHLYGLAIDVVPWTRRGPSWKEELFPPIEKAFKEIIKTHDLYGIDWGYDLWGKDKPHWQLSRDISNIDMRLKYNVYKIKK